MYGKMFESAYRGSMYGAGAEVFAVWPWIISHTKADGYVEINPKEVGNQLGIPLPRVKKALEYLSTPDPNSRSKVHEGRRLVKHGEFLYIVVNYLKYRGLTNDAERKEYYKTKQRESRGRRRRKHEDAMYDYVKGQFDRGKDLVPTRTRPIVALSVLTSMTMIDRIQLRADELRGWQIRGLFSYWCIRMKKEPARTYLDEGRWRLADHYIERYGMETCLFTVDGALKHPDMNHGDGKTFHNFHEIFMRGPAGGERVEKLSEFARKRFAEVLKVDLQDIEPHPLIKKHPELAGQIEEPGA